MPVLPNGNTVVMDNASFINLKRFKNSLNLQDVCSNFFLLVPLTSIRLRIQWAQAKARRRKLACSVEKLFWQPAL